MAKKTTKQIKAQAINECAKQFRSKIENFESRLKAQVEINRSYQQRNKELQAENLELKEQLEKYKDWNCRLQEYMDMKPDERKKAIQAYEMQEALNVKIEPFINIMSRFFM
jgi:predicted nuclease with TOPRIM domain